ncbi:MAG TPA: hypothetical protein VHG10_16000 [Glycomyces sp.]|nr:hypothetical protein [Glycomyces sp.]
MTQYQSKSKGHKHNDPGMELSIGQVLAACGATVLGAVLAKVFNLWGTIPGTAFLSVFSSIGAVLILRTIRRTGDRVKSQIQAMSPKGPARGTAVTVKLAQEKTTATAKVPDSEQIAAQKDTTGTADTAEIPLGEPETVVAHAASRKQTLVAILISSVLVFGLTVGTLYFFGALAGDPGRFATTEPDSDRTTTIIIQTPAETEDTGEASESPSEESASPGESASESPSESPSPTETATENPTESTTGDTGQGGSAESPSPETPEETATESPTAG